MADIKSKNLWGDADRTIISIGTGSVPGKSLDGNIDNLVRALASIILDAESRSEVFFQANKPMLQSKRLFRFDVFHGLENIRLEEYKKVPEIATATNTYLNLATVNAQMHDCAASLIGQGTDQSSINGDRQSLGGDNVKVLYR